MQTSQLKTLGFVLLLSALIVALVLQATGYGLVTNRVPQPPTQTTTAGGVTMTMVPTRVTVVHLLRVVPLAALGITGLVCIAMGWRREPREVGY